MSAPGEVGVGRSSKLATILGNAAVVLVSTILSYLVIEAVFFRAIFPIADAGVRPHLPETPGVLAQSTKAGYVPRDYIAILGDSMAEGLGDTLLAAGHNEARTFHAAHVLRDLTGKDVVSFGRGGSSSAESMVRQPARILAGSHCLIFPTIDAPSRIFAYFYEGNDIQDNLVFARKVEQKLGRSDRAAIDAYLSDQYAHFPSWQCHLYLFDIAGRMAKFFHKYYVRGVDPYVWEPAADGSNIQIGEDTIAAPSPLDGPVLELGDERIRAGIEIFDRSLAWLKARFPDVPITVVYIPSALSTYHLTGESYRYSIEPREDRKSGWASVAQITRNSDLLCQEVRTATARHRVGFLDTRPGLREAAATRPLHGPVDWVHFNAQGYRVLGALLARERDPALLDSCH